MTKFRNLVLMVSLSSLSFLAFGAEATPSAPYLDVGKATAVLVKIAILAILLEVALTTLFNWRWFLRWADGRGMKMPIALIAAMYFVYSIGGTNDSQDIDVVSEILNATGDSGIYSKTILGKFISALIIAGGSASVFTLFEKLGLRNPIQNQQRVEAMRAKATLSIKLLRQGQPKNNSAVTVLLNGEIIGTISEGQQKIAGNNTIEIEPGSHKIELHSYDANNNKIFSPSTSFSIRAGATVTHQFKLSANSLS